MLMPEFLLFVVLADSPSNFIVVDLGAWDQRDGPLLGT
jgi:hypothetical protein